jgi:hypothetical protein
LARKLFDNGLLSVLSLAGAIGVGWKLHFYTGGTTTPITTYNARTAGSANTNPLIADASGRFPVAWIPDGQTIKWVLADENDAAKVTVDDFLIDQATAAASIDASLTAFLAGAALPIANGGTASTSAANALVALGALALAGGTMTGNIVRSGKGIHPYFSNASMTGGRIFVQAAGADPTSLPGDWVAEY